MICPPTQTVSIYGLKLVLPFDAPCGLGRIDPNGGCHPAERTITFRSGSIDPIDVPRWDSADESRILIDRRGASTVVSFGDDLLELSGTDVSFSTNRPTEMLDLNYNPLSALILPHVQMVAFHAFVVDTPWGRLAVTGESGAGKTTLGREFLTRDGRLVADDLLALDASGRAHDGPPFIRVVEADRVKQDIGGKHRRIEPPGHREAAPIDVYVVLDDVYKTPTPLEATDALDAILSRPYSPAASTREETLLRLTTLLKSLASATVLGLPCRWRPPAHLADTVTTYINR